ncbi:hypothetical protein R3W88_033004 [Solanum pinnatisectum]|uniref:Uncharacterized protein n=1 Tax=Solanum pinnatisectum TaxID=50273 RepID=A0AAV9K5K5_9SOLN|nr:hypothetical protein R3W88_033004 [Solanum pinnatisectum]
MFLTYEYMRNRKTKTGRMVLKSRLSLKELDNVLSMENVIIRFTRRTYITPSVPLETKYHPSTMNILLIKRLIMKTSKQTLLQFLQHEFVNIGKSH